MYQKLWKSLVTGNEYSYDDFNNHGYGERKHGKMDLPKEYPFTIVDKEDPLECYIKRVNTELEKLGFFKSENHEKFNEYDKRFANACAKWMIGPIMGYLNKNAIKIEDFPIDIVRLRGLIEIVEFTNLISFSNAVREVFPEMIRTNESAYEIIEKLDLFESSDNDEIKKTIISIIEKYPYKVQEYKNGKVGVLNMIMGEVMKSGKGKFNPKLANDLLKNVLDSHLIF